MRRRWRKYKKALKEAVVSQRSQIALCCATVVGIPLLAYGFRETFQIEVNELQIALPDLPPAFDGYRILQVSDIHCSRIGRREKRLLELINDRQANLLVLTGDYQYRKTASKEPALDLLRRIGGMKRFPDGILAIFGNHDHNKLRRIAEHIDGIQFLRDRHRIIHRNDQRIAVCGIDYPRRRASKITRSLEQAQQGLAPDTFQILLAHTPDAFPYARNANINLMLTGDTHGGQIRLPGFGAIFKKTRMPREFSRGLNETDGALCFTNAGIGVIGLPCRLFCRPEIASIRLQRRP